MKIRFTGLADEIQPVIDALQETAILDVLEINGPYPNRGDSRMVRVYLEARPPRSCSRTWHDGDCCDGAREQRHPDAQAIRQPQHEELPS
ncbi:MAG: hypothetical protein ACRDPY_07975 [Streptosporangiaceae bacterium]